MTEQLLLAALAEAKNRIDSTAAALLRRFPEPAVAALEGAINLVPQLGALQRDLGSKALWSSFTHSLPRVIILAGAISQLILRPAYMSKFHAIHREWPDNKDYPVNALLKLANCVCQDILGSAFEAGDNAGGFCTEERGTWTPDQVERFYTAALAGINRLDGLRVRGQSLGGTSGERPLIINATSEGFVDFDETHHGRALSRERDLLLEYLDHGGHEHTGALSPNIAGESPADVSKPRKRSTVRGEGTAKLIAALTLHHKYANHRCQNEEPIGNNELAKVADVKKATASTFFRKQFGGHSKYRTLCLQNPKGLAQILGVLNGDAQRKGLAYFGRTPPGEGHRHDEE